jgi:hypothetical protein
MPRVGPAPVSLESIRVADIEVRNPIALRHGAVSPGVGPFPNVRGEAVAAAISGAWSLDYPDSA